MLVPEVIWIWRTLENGGLGISSNFRIHNKQELFEFNPLAGAGFAPAGVLSVAVGTLEKFHMTVSNNYDALVEELVAGRPQYQPRTSKCGRSQTKLRCKNLCHGTNSEPSCKFTSHRVQQRIRLKLNRIQKKHGDMGGYAIRDFNSLDVSGYAPTAGISPESPGLVLSRKFHKIVLTRPAR